MSTIELIYEKARALPDSLQSEALGFVEYLARRGESRSQSVEWQKLSAETQGLPVLKNVSDADIIAEIAAYRSGR